MSAPLADAADTGGKSFGTAGRGKGVSADVEVPIVKTGKQVVTVVERIRTYEAAK